MLSALAAVGADALRRAPICAAVVEIALAAGRLEDAAAAEAELAETAARYATSGLEAIAATARGAVLLAEGRAAEVLPVLRGACRRWYELGVVYDAAKTCLRLIAVQLLNGFGGHDVAEDRASVACSPARARSTAAARRVVLAVEATDNS